MENVRPDRCIVVFYHRRKIRLRVQMRKYWMAGGIIQTPHEADTAGTSLLGWPAFFVMDPKAAILIAPATEIKLRQVMAFCVWSVFTHGTGLSYRLLQGL